MKLLHVLMSLALLGGGAAPLLAQVNHLQVPYVKANVTIDGVFGAGEWDGALVVPVEGQTPQTNPGWNPLNGNAIAPADLSYNLYVMHDGVYFHVAFDVTDDSVSDDYTASRPDHTEVWNDDCTEVFINGDRDQDVTESAGGSPVGDRDWREGQQPHFGVRANSHWENNSGTRGRIWWAATTRTASGYRTEYRFAFRGIDTADGEANFEPLKTGETIGFSVLVNDDDNGGDREDQLAWIGGGTNDSLFRTQSFWGTATMVPPPNYTTPGIPTRGENTSLLIDTVPNNNPGSLTNVRVFPRLNFENPMLLLESPDTSGRLFVVEQRGRIRSFVKATDPAPGDVTTFLDATTLTRNPQDGSGELEEGLLGLAFDPDFATNGEFYVYYSARPDPRRLRVSRFTANPPGAATVNLNTEEVLLEIPDPAPTHNAGMIAFGPDGMLYIGVGDGGGVGDNAGAGNNAQNTTLLLGKFLRIDVRSAPDAGLAYRIPPDNPFYTSGPAGTSTRKEIYAYGLRNPWRWSFDAQTGALLAGDVGQGRWEEVNVIKSGRNYGWRRVEGPECYEANCTIDGTTAPIAYYSHSEGQSITGGFTYYGPDVPSLYGKYIYGDYVTAKVWTLTYNPLTDVASAPVEVADLASFFLGAFGQDKSGEVYLLNLANGSIHVLRPGTNNNNVPLVTNPAPPVRGSPVTITYNATNRTLEGSQNIFLYMGVDGWTGITNTAMTNQGSNVFTRTVDVPLAATVLDIVFNNGTQWDNNDGADWHIATVEGSGGGGPTVVSTAPTTPVRGQPLTITYDSTGRNLANAAAVRLHWGINGWTQVTQQAMTSLGSGRHSITITVPANATVVDFVFTNGAGTWDNNAGADWHLNTVAAKTASSLAAELKAACNGTRPFPTRLSDIPALLAAGLGEDQTNLGIIPYEPSAKLWSDGTHKERFMAIPGVGEVGYREQGGWDFPEDTVLIKNFLLPLDERNPAGTMKRIETRLMIRDCDVWYGFSYEWNEGQTDAVLLTTSKTRPFQIIDEAGATFNYEWLYPSQAQCTICHTPGSNHVLGLTTAQMNHDFTYPRSGVRNNQLYALNYVSLFGTPGLPGEPSALPRMPDPADTTAPIRDRARAYLAANCAHCHQPGSGGGGGLDLRWETADNATGMINGLPGNDLGIADARIVAPGSPARSILYQRVHTVDPDVRMPPLASSRIDEEGSEVLRQWILSLSTTTDTPTATPSPTPSPTQSPTSSPTASPSPSPVPPEGWLLR